MKAADIATPSMWPDFTNVTPIREAKVTLELNRKDCAPYFEGLQDYMRWGVPRTSEIPKDIKIAPGVTLTDVYAITSLTTEPVELTPPVLSEGWLGPVEQRRRQRAMTHVTITLTYLQYERTSVAAPSYHDVTVTVNGTDYNLFNEPYDLVLMCARASGWELWRNAGSKIRPEELIGGEFNHDDFKITVAGAVICERKKDDPR